MYQTTPALNMGLGFLVSLSNLVLILPLVVIGSRRGLAAGHHGQDHHHRRLAAADIPDFISIDCGASEDITDVNNGMPYKSDRNLIDSGESHQISPEFYGNLRLQYRSLRSFPIGIKNCYTVKLEEVGKDNNYLIRAHFIYGNYDGKNSTPIFDVYLGVNLWEKVYRDGIWIEAIHTATTDYIDVCLVNVGSGVPYISSLELRRLDNSIYHIDNDHFLVLSTRYDVGGKEQFRYPQDSVDRIWGTYNEDFKRLETDAGIMSNDDPYKLPPLMLQTASGTENSSIPFIYRWFAGAPSSLFYFCFHFAEIEKPASGKLREMSIVLNGAHNIAESVKLEYLKPHTICSKVLPVNLNQENYLRISSALNSDLPPIINGLEIFYYMELSNSPTFSQDVNAIMDIKKTFKQSSNWQGDPCLPTISVWKGLNCSDSNPPRIISLNLSRSNLIGDIPFSLSSLTELEALDLSYNDLSGSLPEFLAQLPRLKTLNLAGNNLEGVVPEALLMKSRDGVLLLNVTANPRLCLSPPCKKKEFVVPVLVAVIAALILLILLGLLAAYIRKKKRNSIQSKEKGLLKQKNREYNYVEIVNMTDNFKSIIGEGGFGKVYLGLLNDKTPVAVKLLSPLSNQGYKEFQAEAQLLMIVHHRNLVSLIGYCDEGDNKALIYEYMANGNLQQHLAETKTNTLRWNERLTIAIDAAHGLEYLHNGCNPPIIHRDLKPTNILLDDTMQAKIADFGLSRAYWTGNGSQISTRLAGTPGYLDLGNQNMGNLNKQGDIYSFGIILFELITGSPAMTRGYGGNYVHILDWVTPIIHRGDIKDVVDMRLKGEFNQLSAWKLVEIATLCTQPIANQRPDISHILEELKECFAINQRTSIESQNISSRILVEAEIAPYFR